MFVKLFDVRLLSAIIGLIAAFLLMSCGQDSPSFPENDPPDQDELQSGPHGIPQKFHGPSKRFRKVSTGAQALTPLSE